MPTNEINKELDKTLVIDNEIYNINAVFADTAKKVQAPLNINKSQLNGETKEIANFNGSVEKNITIVPADGGKFTGRITVPAVTANTLNSDSSTVLNYADIKNHVVPKLINNSVAYSWDGTELNSTINNAICSISIIYGKEEHAEKFAQDNFNKSELSSYLYICSDTKNIYYGTVNSASLDKLVTEVTKSETATKLITPRKITTNLSKNAVEAKFDGTADIEPRVTGVLDPVNGGTGSTTLSNITVGTANTLRDASDGRKSATAIDVINNRTDIDNIISGATYVAKAYNADNTSKLNGQSASYYQKKITINTRIPTNEDKGSNGDIWIAYQK